ncbi:hypothetical protein EPI10_000739 [Gossypium australe]|uniref:Uncharacterized protein n=1 Tax=Gossypium australe TaxID=47621 RepID=A0A5B6V8T1_9ROSI|nr:hypothetical protein EPI10_000739 [Gossypium australe]
MVQGLARNRFFPLSLKRDLVRGIWENGTRVILAGEGSLWVTWIKEYVLKGHTFWEVAPSSTCN